MGIQGPCTACEDRKLGCHGTCERYISYEKANRELKEKIRKDRELGSVITSLNYAVRFKRAEKEKKNGK